MNVICLATLLQTAAILGVDDATRVVVTVNGTAITAGDVEFAATTRQVKAEERAAREPKLIEELIDRQLIREYLAKRKITAPDEDLAFQIRLAEDAIRKHGDDPAILLPKLGYTPERLKSELSLPLAWQYYARHTITLPQTKEYFDQHRAELDGTRLRARQIFLKLPTRPTDADVAARSNRLKELKAQVTAGKISFADCARMNSESPSKEQGGDVGYFGPRGKLPTPVTQAAFALKVNDLSDPIVSAFGVHLLQVTERIPGDLSLEDVRPQIMERLSEQLWAEAIQTERKTAKIERRK
ncbi:MAG: peptidylprolyl isomerase [Planctomycetes bacterium]|nr:peptidylprolyl isomerase [Planctomycetota bacterium]